MKSFTVTASLAGGGELLAVGYNYGLLFGLQLTTEPWHYQASPAPPSPKQRCLRCLCLTGNVVSKVIPNNM